MGFPRQEYWSRLPFPPPGGLPTQGSNPCLLTFPPQEGRGFFTTEPLGSPSWFILGHRAKTINDQLACSIHLCGQFSSWFVLSVAAVSFVCIYKNICLCWQERTISACFSFWSAGKSFSLWPPCQCANVCLWDDWVGLKVQLVVVEQSCVNGLFGEMTLRPWLRV